MLELDNLLSGTDPNQFPQFYRNWSDVLNKCIVLELRHYNMEIDSHHHPRKMGEPVMALQGAKI